jgi:hypothetical protein
MEVYVINLKDLKDHLKITEIFIRHLSTSPYTSNYSVSKNGGLYEKNIEFRTNKTILFSFLKLDVEDCLLGLTKNHVLGLRIPFQLTKKAIFSLKEK